MLKKLRMKFMLINMIIVTVMLAVIFGMLYYSTGKNMERESIQLMRNLALQPMHEAPPNAVAENLRLPYFSIMIDKDGSIIKEGDFFNLTDEDIEEVIQMISVSDNEIGLLNKYGLRYLQAETPIGRLYIFTDTSNELATRKNLVRSFFFVGSAAFLLFLLISFLLAKWAIKPVEKSWQQQKQFIADASHELKTPLTVIMTDADLLNTADCPEDERKQLSASILSMARQMRGLVDRLLELARIDGNSKAEPLSPLSFSDLIQDTVMQFEPLFFENGLVFSYEIEADTIIKGNKTQLKQVVEILLDNAIKYSGKAGKTNVHFQQTAQKKCLLSVSNQGDPIQEEDLKNLFVRFYRADKARTGGNGYGLGLSIAESIVRKHHGRIWVESAKGYNSFYVEFPI